MGLRCRRCRLLPGRVRYRVDTDVGSVAPSDTTSSARGSSRLSGKSLIEDPFDFPRSAFLEVIAKRNAEEQGLLKSVFVEIKFPLPVSVSNSYIAISEVGFRFILMFSSSLGVQTSLT